LGHSRCARSLRGRSFLRLVRAASLGMRIAVTHHTGSLQCVAGRVTDCNAPPEPAEGRCVGLLFGAFEMRAVLAGTLVSSPRATHLSCHVWGRSLGHSRCARSLRGRSFLRLLRHTSRGMCGAALLGIRDARAPCRAALFSASCDPPRAACAGPLLCLLCGAFEMRALLAGLHVFGWNGTPPPNNSRWPPPFRGDGTGADWPSAREKNAPCGMLWWDCLCDVPPLPPGMGI